MASEKVPSSHGNSPAAWTAVGILMIGTLVCAVSFPLTSVWLFVVGLLIALAGLVVGKLMAMAGYGSLPSYEVQEPNPTVLEGPTTSSEEDASLH